ncbi:hypothetical protein CABS01_16441 [Colletotrichum abscissum]|uniref:uncharacterized protein n=1 Tax=Colletotrichum abscissum TaxID=1671311 RepID=UPI0027D6D6BD|nr:uncharacterized protein CABS01_16441 [Colletotrichum abscissum]KAK1471179.1 hypothetical protein CABS01_16441 [Colletotrichum abscissum]
MTTLTKDLVDNARILADVGHDPRSVATRPQSIANMSHAKKGIISTNETDRAVSIWRLGFLLQLEDNRLRQHWKSIRKLSRVLRHIHRHLRDGKTPGAHAQEWVAYLQTVTPAYQQAVETAILAIP